MKKHLFIALFILVVSPLISKGQQQQNMPLLGNWDDNTLPTSWAGTFNDCWGYAAPDGKEYAIMGDVMGTYFFNISNPAIPIVVNFFRGKDTLGVHRDYKTYGHYAYGVSDEGNSSLQIFDLQYLPDSVVKVYDSDQYTIRCHNIFISGDKLYLASNTTSSGFRSMDVLSLTDPANPTFISTLTNPQFWHVHDVYVRNDTAYCSAGNAGLFIYDYSNPTSPQLIQSITSYPEQGYNHSSWVSEDGKSLVFADEDHGKGLKLYDISNLSNPVLLSVFRSNLLNVSNPTSSSGSIPHNPFIKGNKLFISYYHDGVVVFDISNPSVPVQFAWHDTYPQNTDYASYKGAWGVYPFLPSGNIIASDIDNGLFILDGSLVTSINANNPANSGFTIYPNPTKGIIKIFGSLTENETVKVNIFDLQGRKMMPTIFNFNTESKLNIEDLATGTYFLEIRSEQTRSFEKIVKF